MSRESKVLSFKVEAKGVTKDEETGQEFGHLECYAAVFNVIDEGNDRILPGAFKRTIHNAKDRAVSRNKKYLIPMLWQHNPNEVIGGWYAMEEDAYGLLCKGDIMLATQRGREYWELARAQMSDLFSIAYEVMPQGAKYDKSGVRELLEMRLFSCDPVTFAMNEDTLLVDVKSADPELKAVCGNTSGPIGPRDESWDGSKAKKQIFAAAAKADGSLNAAVCKKYFMVVDGDAQQKGSYSYPFWYVSGSPHICVGAVKAIAGNIMGSRGASPPSGLKAKVETLYRRINAKYPDDPELVPPWKGKSMDNETLQRKDFNDEYRQRQISDWCSGWYSLSSALKSAIMDAFDVGDMPMDDAMAALNGSDGSPGFIDALKEWVQDGIDLDFSNYLDELEQNNTSSYYGYMSHNAPHEHKAGATFSASTRDMLGQHTGKLHTMGDQLHQMATDLAATTGATTFDDSSGKPATDDSTKSASPPPTQAPGTSPSTDHPSSVDTDREEIDESDIDMALARLKLGLLTRI
jgi:HK97 family phage prohead protease